MTTPVLIITYNRFDNVLQILKILDCHDFRNVYLSIDNYWNNKEGFAEIETFLIERSFSYKLLKREKNVGCDHNVVEGIKWFFTNVEEGIILEDDCIPTDNLFEFIKGDVNTKNISLFSTNIDTADSFFLRESYVPIFWGWFSNKLFFDGFYEFYQRKGIRSKHIIDVFRSQLSTKAKMIIIINYYAHKIRQKGLCWDSELLFYKVITRTSFFVPSYSLINNVGFGNAGIKSTHTIGIPAWYSRIKLKGKINMEQIEVLPQDFHKDNLFFDLFYKDYSNNRIKLALSLIDKYCKYLIRSNN